MQPLGTNLRAMTRQCLPNVNMLAQHPQEALQLLCERLKPATK